jgi:RNA polymerase sigma factor (TIGR02999 family)
MRRILVDHARRHNLKRGRGVLRVALEDVVVMAPGENADTDLVALDEALIGLTRIDPRKAQIVEMRFFGGLTVEEIGEVLKVSTGTIKRDWRAAKAWLYQELTR